MIVTPTSRGLAHMWDAAGVWGSELLVLSNDPPNRRCPIEPLTS